MARCLWGSGIRAGTTILVIAVSVAVAFAQQDAGAIANSLAPKPALTRGLTPIDPHSAQDQKFIDGLRNKATRSITVEERDQVAAIAKEKPGIDLEVNFDFDSAVVGPPATDALIKLGLALRDPRLKGATVLLAGHTDAKGSEAYNKDLSDRRAEVVKQFLVTKFQLSPENLIAVGYGKERLKNTADPYAAENRRVQVANMSAQ